METGAALGSVLARADCLASAMHIRIVDKGLGLMRGFRNHEAWGQMHTLLHDEGYVARTQTTDTVAGTPHSSNTDKH